MGTTKTLAKLANHIAKTTERKPGSYPESLSVVCNLETLAPSDRNDVVQVDRKSSLWRTRSNDFGYERYVSFRYVHGVNATLSL